MHITTIRNTLRQYGCRGGNLLSYGVDPKTAKSNALGEWYTAIQYLAPANIGGWEVCASRSAGCTDGCLNTSGNPIYAKGKERARLARKRLYFENREEYLALLFDEIAAHCRRCERMGRKSCLRLNGTSDIVWERVAPQIFEAFPQCQFYDYTKIPKRCAGNWKLPPNYHLTFSRSEINDLQCSSILADKRGSKVAVVFSPWRTRPLPSMWGGHRVVDGDKHDLRFLDRGGRIVGVRAKGRARYDRTGFVIQCN